MFGKKKREIKQTDFASELYRDELEKEIANFTKPFLDKIRAENQKVFAIIKKQGRFNNLLVGFFKSTENWDAVKVQSKISGWDMCCKVVDADDVLDLNGNPKIMRRMIQAINGVI